MSEAPRQQIVPGSYNDAKISQDGAKVLVSQNPKMFIVLGVIALIIGIAIIILGGSGTMEINQVQIPQPVAGILSVILGGAFILAAGGCAVQSLRPATLILDPVQGTFASTPGILGLLFQQRAVSGSLSAMTKLVLAKECFQSSSGKSGECWRLTLHGPEGKTWNLGSFDKAETAGALAEGFAALVDKPLERT